LKEEREIEIRGKKRKERHTKRGSMKKEHLAGQPTACQGFSPGIAVRKTRPSEIGDHISIRRLRSSVIYPSVDSLAKSDRNILNERATHYFVDGSSLDGLIVGS